MPAKKQATKEPAPIPVLNEPDYWRKQIPEEYVVLNKFALAAAGVDVDSLSAEELEKLKAEVDDSKKLILLQGLKEVARLRGYSEIRSDILPSPDPAHAVAAVTIRFNPSEEHPYGLVVTQTASADFKFLSEGFGQHREAIAENRALSRAIRLALNIPILSSEEIDDDKTGKKEKSQTPSSGKPPGPVEMLKSKAESKGMTIEQIAQMIEERWPAKKPRSITSFSQVKPAWAFELCGEVDKQ